MAPSITIVVPNYNRRDYLRMALMSAIDQTAEHFEVLVVDDCSTDDSVSMVEQMRRDDSRIRILVHSRNKGVSAARNTGIRGSASNYVTFLDSDDLFSRERVERLLSRLKAGNMRSVVYSDAISIDEKTQGITAEPSNSTFRPEGSIFNYLLMGAFRIVAGPIALPRKLFEDVGLYDETLRYAEDLDLALRLSSKFDFLFERVRTYGWRTHGRTSSGSISARERYRDESRVLERHLLSSMNTLDSTMKKRAFDRLFGCYIASHQWKRLLRVGLSDRQALNSALTIPSRTI